MTNGLGDRWGLDPGHFWMWEKQAEQPVEADGNGMVHVYGHAETVEVYGDPRRYSNNIAPQFLGATEDAGEFNSGSLLQSDPPHHTKLRKIISRAFTPRMVAGLEPRIIEVTHELLDAADVEAGGFELVDDLTYPMPVIVIAELLGIPHSDRGLFKKWVDQMFAAAGVMAADDDSGQPDDADTAAALRRVPEMLAYLHQHAVDRRKRPREDLFSELVHAEVDGARLSDDAVVDFANELLIVGHGTTTALLGNMLLCLDAHPQERERLRKDPARAAAVTEETLRFLSPIAGSYRVATADTELAGVPVAQGQLLTLWLGAANRDERVFERPHVFDPDRTSNPHFGFGRGIHFCLGAPLARLEARTAVNILLDRCPTLRTDPDNPPEFLPIPDLIGTSKLPLLTG
ncbi:cytochrome P450 [Streptomyces sp. NPDC017940]|uniref:cytochrome P450 n=1 Tax=Streptomyces sp. NPDC017940 TaxID=3365017 RepID=UPI0037BC0626